MLSAKKMIDFLLVSNKIKKDKTYSSYFDDEVVCNSISSSSSASSFFDASQKFCDDIIVFIIDQHMCARSSNVVLVANHQNEEFSAQMIDIVNEVHEKQMISSHQNSNVF